MRKLSDILACYGVLIMMFSLPALPAQDVLAEDWIVNGTEFVENDTVLLDGDLIVENGGDLTLRGVTLTMNKSSNGPYGIRVKPGSAITIEEGTVISAASDSAHFSFSVESGSQFLMRNSELHRCGWGPDSEELGDNATILSGIRGLVIDTNNAVIEGNTFSNNHVGIIFTGSGITLDNNNIHSNKVHGIYAYKASDCQIENNSIQHSTISSPFRIVEGQNNAVTGNEISQGITRGAIENFASDGNTFQDNTISGLGVAICLYFSSHNNIVVGNTLSTNETGIIIWGWNNRVEDNIIANPGDEVMTGIFMVYAYNTVVADNDMSTISNEGIWLRDSSNNTIIGNAASGMDTGGLEATYGILFSNFCSRNVVYGNRMSYFKRGVGLFYDCDENTIVSNEFVCSGLQAALIADSLSNRLYGNNFMGGGQIPYDNGANHWDSEGMGNYWSDYKGTDGNNDGIGDEPYPVNPEGIDHFPLMAPVVLDTLPRPETEKASRPVVGSLLSRTVTGNETIENQTIYLGNIDVASGASLTLRNVRLITGGNTHHVSDLGVSSGGTLIIEDSEITHLEYGCGFQLQPQPGSTFVMRNSVLQTCGHEWPYGGLQISTDNVVLENNLLIDSFTSFWNTSGASIVGNIIERSCQGISLVGSSSNTVSGNTIRNMKNAAVQADGSHNTFRDNNIYNVWEFGINVNNSEDCLVEENIIMNLMGERAAISVGGTSHSVKDNNISDCGLGIRIGNGHIATGNTIQNCLLGLEIGWDNSHVEGNLISNCTVGVDLSGATHTFVGNVISTCETGLTLDRGSSENVLYHNNFLNNTLQAEDAWSNHWDHNCQGNYWSDYQGVDANGDGIGDTPYNIGSNAEDHYPLMTAFNAPVVITTEISSITSNGAISGGNITSDGGYPVTVRGVCWSESANPTTSNPKTLDGAGRGNFTSYMTGLSAGTTYHVRAYAMNRYGTGYGADLTFTTNSPLYVSLSGNCGENEPCYHSIQDAVNDADNGDAILIADGTYGEAVTLNASKSLTLQGGWSASFDSQAGTTILRNAPKAPKGRLTLQGLNIKPQ